MKTCELFVDGDTNLVRKNVTQNSDTGPWLRIYFLYIFPIIIIIIFIIIISFMHGIYTYIPETNYVPTEYSVAAVLLLLFMVLISLVSVLNLLYFYISTFRSMCAVLNIVVFPVCCSRIFWMTLK